MVYRFKLVSDEVSNFSREIEIDSENTFLQLRNSILESVGYTKDELDSFSFAAMTGRGRKRSLFRTWGILPATAMSGSWTIRM